MLDALPITKFGDTAELAAELATLILRGIKTATCSALREYQQNNEDLPKVGAQTIVEDGSGKKVCIIETTDVRLVPFDKIDENFAHAEGEGDLSLSYWQKEHKRFFRSMGYYSSDMILVCEHFRLVQAL